MEFKHLILCMLALLALSCTKEPVPQVEAGQVVVLQTATEGNGIDVVLMGDGYTAKQIADGVYDQVMRASADAFFMDHPFSSFRHLFNVYYVVAVSKDEGCVSGHDTYFASVNSNGTRIEGNRPFVRMYAEKALGEERAKHATMVVMMNVTLTAGTCWYDTPFQTDYGDGAAIAFVPYCNANRSFQSILTHEACGHAFAKLGDEYAYKQYGEITNDARQRFLNMVACGCYKNLDLTSNKAEVKWHRFIEDPRYASENISVYMGGYTYYSGVYRPTSESKMNSGYLLPFNAPSREAIYYKIHKMAYGSEWEYDYEEFVKFDLNL